MILQRKHSKRIKQIAESYKNQIPVKLYEAMIKYKININD